MNGAGAVLAPSPASRRVTSMMAHLLRVPAAGRAIEALACAAGRHPVTGRAGRTLVYHVREGLRLGGRDDLRFARLPGGARVAVRLSEHLWQFIYFRGWFEPETTRFVIRHLRRGDVFVDVGANVGYYTMIGARRVGRHGRVHAFEPNRRASDLLELSVRRAGFQSRVTLERAAVTASDGAIDLHLPSDTGDTGQASTVAGWVPSAATVRVPAVRLDGYCRRVGIRSIRLMKLDVEGGELDALRGAEEVLFATRPDAVLCEFVSGRNEGAQLRVLDLFERARYRPFQLGSRGDLLPIGPGLPDWAGLPDAFGSIDPAVRGGNLCMVPEELAP